MRSSARFSRAATIALAALHLSCNEGFELVLESLTVPASVLPGDPLPAKTRICNRGDAPSDLAQIEFQLQPVSPPGPLVSLGPRGVPPLEPDQCHTEQRILDAPGGLPDGSYRLVGTLTPGGHEGSSALFGIGWLPNLVVEELEAPPSAEPFGSLGVSGLVCNRGTEWSPPFGLSLYLSSDAQLEGPPADLPLGEISLPGLPPGACVPFEQEAPAPDDGLYLLGAIVDPAGGVAELLEEDNVRLLDLVAVGWLPDLVVTSLDAPNATTPGEDFEVTSVVCNQGTVSSPPSDLALFFSDDAVIVPLGPEPGDFPLGSLSIPPLPPGACRTESGPVFGNVPNDGAWVLGAIVDLPGAVEELIEANNTFAGPLMGVGFGPDLVVESIETPPSAGHGEEFDVTARICNRGTAHANPSMIRIFHSLDGELSAMPFGDDPEIGNSSVPPLAPGVCTQEFVNASSASMLSGPVTVIAMADGFAELTELLETNNETVGPIMGIGWEPDLVVASLGAPPSVLPGAFFDVTLEVCNQGTEPSPPTLVRVYHSVDPVISGIGPIAGDDWYAGDVVVPQSLAPGACVSLEGSVIAEPFAQGARHLGAAVDEPGFVDELIETNNTLVGPPMGVGTGPDLVVTQLSGPASSLPGPLPLDFEVCNQGTAGSPSAQVSFYDSGDAVIEGGMPEPTGDRWLGSESVPPLGAGSCHAGSASAWMPPGEFGPRHLGAIVDEWNSIDELVETNNVFVGPVLGVGSGPDLVLTQVLAPPSVENGEFLALDIQVCNQGTSLSPGAQVSLYFSSDAEIQGSYFSPGPDPWLDTVFVPPLAPGDCEVRPAGGFAYVPFDGAWHVGGVVDEGLHVAELIESNNAYTGGIVGVGFGPDLVITTLAGPASVPVGTSFSVDVEVCNQGTAPSAPTSVYLYHSEDLVIDGLSAPPPGADPLLGGIWLPNLAPGACHFEATSVSVSAPGAGFLAAIVDEFAYVPELIETNNERIGGPLEVTGP